MLGVVVRVGGDGCAMGPRRWTWGQKIGALAGLAWAVAGCAPEHNWREVHAPPHRFAVLLPGRPVALTRTVMLAGESLSMTMYGAQAAGVAYTVATVCVPERDPERTRAVLMAARTRMVQNIAGRERVVHADALLRKDLPKRGSPHDIVSDLLAEGQMHGETVQLWARFVAVQGCVWQAAVLGPAPDPDAVALFLTSLRIGP